ncbi:MAG: sugar phosphate isomerase/epimerase [Nitrospirota bacterium]|nr:sugar phosphate isomerase/epimerase [Nitrospirota bacterium]
MDPIHVHIPFPKLKDYRELLRKRKYDLEIYFPSSVLDQLEHGDLALIADALDWGPSITIHAPFMDLNPGAVDRMVRSATQMRFKQVLGVASVLRPRVIVFHAAYDRWRYAGRTDIWLENSMEVWPRVVEAAVKAGTRLAVENVFDEDPEALALLIEKIGHRDFGFCFDTGHFNIFSSVPMEQWFQRLGKHIIETHLHDNAGSADSHLVPGTGTVDFAKFFGLLREHALRPVYTLEAHDAEDIEPGLGRLRELLRSR